MLNKELAVFVEEKTEAATDTGVYVSQLNLLVQLLLGGSLKAIWSVLNIL